MPGENKHHEPFIMVCVTLLVLLFLSLTENRFQIGSVKTRKVNILSEIIQKAQIEKACFVDLKVHPDTALLRHSFAVNPEMKKEYPGIVQFGTDSSGGLVRFFSALSGLGKTRKKVRVAYFGDSMIEGDLITQDVRDHLQSRFGGDGVGFMPVTSIVAGFRQSIIHAFSDNWKDYNLLDDVSSEHGLGITGHTFVPSLTEADSSQATASWVRFAPVGRRHLNRFPNVYLFYGRSDAQNAILFHNDKTIPLEGNAAVNQLQLNPKPFSGFTATFQVHSRLNVYGFSMESDSGLVLDNFSFRGNSGMPLTKMPFSVLSGLNKYLQYDLIILQYGVNVVNSTVTDFSWYEKGMVDVVRHLQNCFPGASILVIGAGDKSTRLEGKYETDPSIPAVVAAQRRVAEITHTAFWNFYEAMGGEGAMVKWVTGDTVYANSDYTHFNYRGANRVGTLLYNYLISEYQKSHKAG
ncbi:MAG TPA: hypothetical protein VGO45_11810 [Bacteroidia bacterium]|nr:hypothetical protein [Bacteroidia bacterium]